MKTRNKILYAILLIICLIALLVLVYNLVYNSIVKSKNRIKNEIPNLIDEGKIKSETPNLMDEETIGLQVFMDYDATEEQIDKIANDLKQIDGIKNIRFVSKEEAYNIMKERLAESEGAMEGFTPDIFAVSFIVELKDEKNAKDIEQKIEEIENVRLVSSNI